MNCRLVLCGLLILCAAAWTWAAPPFITVEGTTMLPLRNFADWVGAKVEVADKTFTLTWQTTTFQLVANSHTALVNDIEIQLHPSALTKMGVLYVPLRPLVMAFSAKLNWDEKNHVVTLTHPATGKKYLIAYPAIESPSLQRLFAAIRANDAVKVTSSLQGQPELLNTPDSAGHTALYVAVETNNLPLVRQLLADGAEMTRTLTANPLTRDPQNGGASPLHAAVMTGNLDLVEALLEKKADINATDYLGVTPLHLAARQGNMTMVQEFIARKAHLDMRATLLPETLDPAVYACADKPGFGTPAMFASQARYDDIGTLLAEKGATALDGELVKALIEAAQRADDRAEHDRQAQAACFTHLDHLYAAFTHCLQDNGNAVPLAKDFWPQLQKYADADTLTCPADPEEPIGYGFNALLCGKTMDAIKDPNKVILFADCSNANHLLWDEDDLARNRHGERFYVLFCDGHKELLSAECDPRLH